MNITKSFWGKSRCWWLLLLAGLLFIVSGFAYWFWPTTGYAVASQLMGWLLVAVGVVQLVISSGEHRPSGWGWWLAGGVIDLFIGFSMVRSVIAAEIILPYFMACIFAYWGITSLVAATGTSRRRRWISLVNGLLMLLISFFFIEGGYLSDMLMVTFIMAIAFIYWGFTLVILGYDMRPIKNDNKKSA